MKYTGLVLDLDRTLIRGEPNSISDKDINAIKQLSDNNIPVVLATGSNYDKANAIHSILGLNTPIISHLGTLITFNEKEVHFPIDKTTVKLLEEWAFKTSTSYTKVYNRGIDYKGNLIIDYLPYVNPKEKDTSNVLQIIFCIDDDDKADCFLEFISTNKLSCYGYLYTSYIVCISSDADKGMALRIVGDELDWDISRFIAIGNYPSDSSLFDEVAKGIVVRSNNFEIPSMYEVVEANSKNVISQVINKYFYKSGTAGLLPQL